MYLLVVPNTFSCFSHGIVCLALVYKPRTFVMAS